MDLTQKEWAARIQEDPTACVLDVRTPHEFEEGYIPTALNLDIYGGQAFLNQLDALDKTLTYYVYCRSGGRSAQACMLMKQRGFTAYNLLGGYLQWGGEIAR